MSEHPIDTLLGKEYAPLLINARIPFRVEYPVEYQAWFYVEEDCLKDALDLMMNLRGSKL